MKKTQKLKEKYIKEVVPALSKEFGIDNHLAIPALEKVVINMGVGDAAKSKERMEQLKKDLAMISGQKPSVRTAKISVASFSIRIGMPVGLKITLREEKMYAFLDRLFSVVLPRIRDFRGVLRKSFDKEGNYTLGVAEHIVFPEIDLAKSQPHGLEVTIVTNTQDTTESERLLELLGMPFERNGAND